MTLTGLSWPCGRSGPNTGPLGFRRRVFTDAPRQVAVNVVDDVPLPLHSGDHQGAVFELGLAHPERDLPLPMMSGTAIIAGSLVSCASGHPQIFFQSTW